MSDETDTARNLGAVLNAYGYWTWAWVLVLSVAGGLANFARRVRAGATHPIRITEFVGELVISAFAGICTFLLCEAGEFDDLLTASLIAISGHMGSRAVFMFENLLEKRLGDNLRPGEKLP